MGSAGDPGAPGLDGQQVSKDTDHTAQIRAPYNAFRHVIYPFQMIFHLVIFNISEMQFVVYNNEELCYELPDVIYEHGACHVRVFQGQLVKKGLLERKVTRSVTLLLNKREKKVLYYYVLMFY